MSRFHPIRSLKSYARRAATLGGLGAKELALQVWRRIDEHDVLGNSAKLAYYFTLALFPLLIFLSTLVGYFFAAEQGIYVRLLNYLARVMPPTAFELVRGTLDEITATADAGTLLFGLVMSLWVASIGMAAVIQALNVAFTVAEMRPWWRRRLVAIILTAGVGVLVPAAAFLILAGSALAERVSTYVPMLPQAARLPSLMQWSVAVFFLLLALTLIFRFAPHLKQPRWEGSLPGAVLTILLWIIASQGLRIYLSEFANYSRTYGSLGAVIILLLWLYVSGAAILIGGEMNAAIWQAVVARRKAAKASNGSERESDGPQEGHRH